MSSRLQVLTRLAIVISATVVLVAGGIAARNLLADENAQARSFVDEGQRALARGDRGAAVLAVERARWLAPRSEIVRSALAATGVKDVEPLLPRTLRLVTSREWSAVAISTGWVAGLGLALAVTRRRSRGTLRLVLGAGATFAVATAGVVESNAGPPAIVTGADAHVLIAPYPTATPEGSLSPGTMLIVGSAYDDFVQVEGGDGVKGWARRRDVERIASPEG